VSHVFGKGGVGGFLGRTFSLKNLVPEVLTIAGGVLGGPIGAGLGDTAGNLIEGRNIGQAAVGGLEAGALDYATAGILGLGGSGSLLSGTEVGNALQSVSGGISGLEGAVGSDITAGLGDVGLGGVASGVGSALGGVGSAASSLGSDISSGFGNLGSSLGITGAGGLTSDISSGWDDLTGSGAASTALTGSTVSNPTLAQSLVNTPGNVTSAIAGAPSVVQNAGGGTILGNLLGGGGGGTSSVAGAGTGGGSMLGGILKTAIGAAPLAVDLLRGNQPVSGQAQIGTSAAQLSAQGTQLQSYLQTGTLPPGAQASINQAVAASQASIRSQYASMGMSGSSAEAQDLANAQTAGVSQATTMAQSLLSTGLQESQMSDQLYQDIMNQALQQDNQLSSAIGTFATAAASAA